MSDATKVESARSADRREWSSRRCWYVVILLTAMYALSFVDRLILALLADPVGRALHIPDAKIGLLVGAGFAVLYALAGLPMAQWIDRRDRRRIVALGVITWSLMTMASALAQSFTSLAVLRAGVAIGEAVLTPAAVSLIADMFPRDRRAAPVAVYAAVSGVMGFGSFIVGAGALELARLIGPTINLAPWRMTFILVGFPGVLLGVLFWATVREPARAAQTDTVLGERTDLRAFVAFLGSEWKFFLPYFIGIGSAAIYAFAKLTWTPALATRAHGMPISKAGFLIGLSGLVTGLGGAFAWPWFVSCLERHGRRDAILICMMISTVLVLPLLIFAPLAQSATGLIGGMALSSAFLATSSVLTPLAMQTYGPSRMRARLMALGLIALNLVGLGAGPLLVPLLGAYWGNDAFALGHGLAILGMTAGPLALLCYFLSWRALASKIAAGTGADI